MKCGGRGVVEHFFKAVQLTIIPQWFFLSLYSVWRWFDFQHNRTRMTRPRQKWHSEISVGPSLTSNKRQQICYKPEHCRTDGQRSLRIWKVQAEDAAVRTSHKVQVILAVAPSPSSCTSFIKVNHITPLITDWLLLLNPVPTRLTCNSYQPSTKWMKLTQA